MQVKEKKLIVILVVLFLITLMVKVVPWFYTFYSDTQQETNNFIKKTNYNKELLASKDVWQASHKKRLEIEKILVKETYQGDSRELIAAQLQGDVASVAKNAYITVESMNLPTYQINENMLLIIQSMSFKSSEAALIAFLSALFHHNPRLIVIDIDVRKYGNMLSGSLKVVGFHKLTEDSPIKATAGEE